MSLMRLWEEQFAKMSSRREKTVKASATRRKVVVVFEDALELRVATEREPPGRSVFVGLPYCVKASQSLRNCVNKDRQTYISYCAGVKPIQVKTITDHRNDRPENEGETAPCSTRSRNAWIPTSIISEVNVREKPKYTYNQSTTILP